MSRPQAKRTDMSKALQFPKIAGHQDIGDRLAYVINKLGKPRAARIVGRSPKQLDRYVAGAEVPTSVIKSLSEAADVSVLWLIAGRDSVTNLIKDLESSGAIKRLNKESRSVPVIGLAECGLVGWYQEGPMAVRAMKPGDLSDPDAFAVMATGTSMIPEGIREGYLCFCSPADAHDPGDVVFVERAGGRASLKTYQGADDDWIYLKGYLPADESGSQASYTDKTRKSEIKRMATVIYIKRKL